MIIEFKNKFKDSITSVKEHLCACFDIYDIIDDIILDEESFFDEDIHCNDDYARFGISLKIKDDIMTETYHEVLVPIKRNMNHSIFNFEIDFQYPNFEPRRKYKRKNRK